MGGHVIMIAETRTLSRVRWHFSACIKESSKQIQLFIGILWHWFFVITERGVTDFVNTLRSITTHNVIINRVFQWVDGWGDKRYVHQLILSVVHVDRVSKDHRRSWMTIWRWGVTEVRKSKSSDVRDWRASMWLKILSLFDSSLASDSRWRLRLEKWLELFSLSVTESNSDVMGMLGINVRDHLRRICAISENVESDVQLD